MSNPLLQQFDLPPFEHIEPEHVEPALDQVITNYRQQLTELIKRPVSWRSLMKQWEELEDALHHVWSPVSHLHAVNNNDSLRQVYERCLDKLVALSTEINHNRSLYEAAYELATRDEYSTLDRSQQQVVQHTLRDFKLAGVHLTDTVKQRFAESEETLARLQNQFQQQVLDATNSWYHPVTERQKLEGLDEQTCRNAQTAASDRGAAGWALTLDEPCYMAVMMDAADRELRRTLYEAELTRASSIGPQAGQWNNDYVMADILSHRQQLAEFLDYENYCEYSVATKMATPHEVESFLQDLAVKAVAEAEKQYRELCSFAYDYDGTEALAPWDVAYYSNKRRQSLYQFSQQTLREYFPLERVLQGLFELVGYLFGIVIRRDNDNVSVWDPHVRFYSVYDEQGFCRGHFYLDLYARANKKGGAWMDECRLRRRTIDDRLQLPIAFLTCNFQPPGDSDNARLNHDEVVTLFHEFGHTLHHLLTQIDHAGVSGINGVPWDAVEFPSQFLEHWAWQKPVLRQMSSHIKTGEPIPEALADNLIASQRFQAALKLVRQLEFAMFDWRVHQHVPVGVDQDSIVRHIQRTLEQVRNEIRVTPVASFDRFQNSFDHIFSGAYAAGYYSYLWAEVLASDAFARFEEQGLWNQSIGRQFLHTILEQGGSEDPHELFYNFRGRGPSVEPLLKHYGIG